MLSNFIDEAVLSRWFSADTVPDNQLRATIEKHNFQKSRPTFREISNRLFRTDNPYHSYKRELLNEPMPYPPHIGERTLSILENWLQSPANLGIEVGSFIGSSAVLLGNFMKQRGGTLLCVDTWCGDIIMWLMDEFVETMGKADGNPKIFDRFMSNMIANNLTQTVVPLRTTAIVAARMLRVLKYEIDFVYLDSAHECGETFIELSLYHDILRPGGVLFGDDYFLFPAIKHDLDVFAKIHDYELRFTGDHDTWIIKKP